MEIGANGIEQWDRIWTPHRREYLKQLAGQFDDESCPFCRALTSDTELVVIRSQTSYVVLNKYPYNSGHLLVCTNRHVATYDLLTEAESADVTGLTQQAMRTLQSVSGCTGFNIGMNQGKVAGAGVQDHFHQHVVPRWANDSNFMPIVAGTKVISELLEQTRDLLIERWQD
ncbi:MAG: HIT domain-containing protein [Actinobacteria bacterium]|nr:HIT domain-containing protein [Actinomycetota bacterium]NBY15532.1 HIT domain-containing protein [Actinomycetota bacterium]